MAPLSSKRCLCDNNRAAHCKPSTMPQDTTCLFTRHVLLSMLGRQNECPSEAAKKLVLLVRQVGNQNCSFFNGVCKELKLSTENAKSTFVQVADEIFANQKNWGRVVSFYVFSVKVAEHFESLGSEEFVDCVISWTADYLKKLRWIEGEGGGWETFQHHFNPEPAPNSSERSSFWQTGLLVTATLGLGAFMAVTCKT